MKRVSQGYWVVGSHDFGEGAAFLPNTGEQFSYYDLNAYFIAWFKLGRQPAITADALYYFHRIRHSDNTSGVTIRNNETVPTEIEILGLLKAPRVDPTDERIRPGRRQGRG